MTETGVQDRESPTPAQPPTPPGGGPVRSFWDPIELGERYGILVLWGVIVLVFSLLKPDTFPTSANFETIFGTQAVQLVITLGLIVSLTAGEFDLSVASVMGFGATARLHTDKVLRLSVDLPIVVECVDTEEKIQAILPELDQMIGGGLITLEKVKVIVYRAE